MNNFKALFIIAISSITISSCKQHQEARKPVSHSSGSFMKKSVERNKKLIAGEEAQIDAVIKRDSTHKYISSKKGYWYYYESRNLKDSLTPKKGDIAIFDYEIKDLNGAVIYSKEELEPQLYKIDKQDIMMGLRDGIKLMRKKEKVRFLFTSNMGYGYHGDNDKIGINQPLFCTVTLHDFMPEADYKKQMQPNSVTPVTATPVTATPATKTPNTVAPVTTAPKPTNPKPAVPVSVTPKATAPKATEPKGTTVKVNETKAVVPVTKTTTAVKKASTKKDSLTN